MIDFQDVAKSYSKAKGRKYIFKDVNFSIPKDTSVAIIGQSQSGKTTLLNLIAGTDYPTLGKIRKDCSVSWLYTQLRYQPSMTLHQNLRFFSRLAGRHDKKAFVREVKELIGDAIDLSKHGSQLSGVQKRELSLAATLRLSFDTYLFKGPINVGKERTDAYQQILKKISQEKQVIIAHHTLSDIREYVDIALVLDGDQIKMHTCLDEANDHIKSLTAV